jgi:hypothetical protein
VLIFSFLFIVLALFLWGRVSLPTGLCWLIPGAAGGIPRDAPSWSLHSFYILDNFTLTVSKPFSGALTFSLFLWHPLLL